MYRKPRKHLSMDSFIPRLSFQFSKIKDPSEFNGISAISLHDCLMACFAVFSLKWPSLLQYDTERFAPQKNHNLQTLYHIKNPPSDTYMRQRLDVIDPYSLRPAFKKIWALLQRGNCLNSFRFLNGYYLVSIDGTGLFSSNTIHCPQCCVKHHGDGSKTYYHQMVGAVLLHPLQKVVIPLCPEPILHKDGMTKNDCEQNASKRLIEGIRRDHPHLKILVVEDALAANAPHIRTLISLSISFLISTKGFYDVWRQKTLPGNYSFNEKGSIHCYRYINGIILNAVSPDIKVNYLEYTEIDSQGREKHFFSWITDIEVSDENICQLVKGGRSRWKIENETFNTLKNRGYHFEHNFGHGKQNLCSVMAFTMMLAFLVDQAQLLSSWIFQKAKIKSGPYYNLWEKLRVLFGCFKLQSWEQLLSCIAGIRGLDTS